MPLSARLAKANTEPKNKRAKTEKKTSTRQKASPANAAASESEASDNEMIEEKDQDVSMEEPTVAKPATKTAKLNGKSTNSKSTRSTTSLAASASTVSSSDSKTDQKQNKNATTNSNTNGIDKKETKKETPAEAAAVVEPEPQDNAKQSKPEPVVSAKIENGKPAKLNANNSSVKLNQTINNTTINSTFNNHIEDTIMTDTTNPIDTDPSHKITSKNSTKPGFCLSVGENLSNQLGLGGEINDRKKPQVVKELPTNIVQIAAGGMHSACLTEDGLVYTFGCNDEFALGRDNDEDIDVVKLPEKIIEITAGDSHTAALSETGVVYAWGTFRDGSGVLGLEQKKIAKTPMRFKLKEKIHKISSGADHLVFLTSEGIVYTAGNSEHGQLGRISKYNSCRGGRRGCDMILVPGEVRIARRKELNGVKKVEDIWTSPYCTFLKVKESNSIIGFGLNNCFQLGIEDAENRYQPDLLPSLVFEGKLKKVIGGMHHTLFLDENGNVYSMGSHRYGCLGLGKVDADVKTPTRIPDLKDIIDIAANTNVSYAIDKNGKAFSWGTNYSKQLGQDDEEDYLKATLVKSKQLDVRDVFTVSIGGQHSLLIASDEKDQDSDQE